MNRALWVLALVWMRLGSVDCIDFVGRVCGQQRRKNKADTRLPVDSEKS